MLTCVNSCSTWIKLSSESSKIMSKDPQPLLVDWWFCLGTGSNPGLHSYWQSSPIVLSINSSTFLTMSKPDLKSKNILGHLIKLNDKRFWLGQNNKYCCIFISIYFHQAT